MSRVYLVDKDHAYASPARFLDADEALRHLRRSALDHDNLQHFRRLWREVSKGGGVQPASDRQVLSGLAARLATGALRLYGTRKPDPEPGKGGGGGAPKPAEPPPEMVPAPPATPPLKLRAPAAPQAPKLPDPIADFAQQAQCLMDAARDGLPFCEQCAPP